MSEIVSNTLSGAIFSDSATLSGTWTDTFNSTGTLTSVSDVSLTVTSTGGSVTTYADAYSATPPYPVDDNTLSSNSYFQISSNSPSGSPEFGHIFIDFASETPTSLPTTATDHNPYSGLYNEFTSVTDNGVTESLVSGGIITTEVSCFMAGTNIMTPAGNIAVETLKTGDLVTLSDGRVAPVSWLGIQTVSTIFADKLRVLPVRIKAGALGEAMPARDLLISPDHAVLVGDILVQAGALVNGVSIVREANVPANFVYYHVEVADHSLILAEGLAAETFVDNVDRLGFDNWAEHEALYGDEAPAIAEMAYPRARSARQVPAAIRSSLAARAVALYGAEVANAA